MKRSRRGRRLTRRQAIGGLAAGAAALSGWSFGKGASKVGEKPGGAIRLEQQATGSEIWQVTTERLPQSNIYCEVPYCSRDSRHFVYIRRNTGRPGRPQELMAVELGTWKQHLVTDELRGIGGCAMTPDGVFYYQKAAEGDVVDLVRVDLMEGKPQKVGALSQASRLRSLGTVSADGRYYACGKRLGDEWKMWGILLADLKTGEERILDRDPYILNPHPQFEPGESKHLMIQHNRGGKHSPDGKLLKLVGAEGATLYVLSAPGGERTTLQVGKPQTTSCTGHEAWIGTTKEMLLSVSASGDYAPEKGNLLGVRAGEPARVVSKGYRFNHVGVSRCGRFFSCDDWQGTYKVVIGSNQTGKSAVVCDSRTTPTGGQRTHPHAYLTPDLKWVIFNSNRSGFPHIHAASVPDGMIEKLSEA